MHSFARLTMVCLLGLVLARACGFGAQMMEVLLLLAPEGTMKKKSNEEMDSEMPVHWCVLSDEVTPWPKKGKGAGGWFNHFPHACEVLLPCWSWFMDRGAQDRCGLVLLDGLTLGRNTTWQHQLVDAMGCQVRHEPLPPPPPPATVVVYSPNLKWLHPRYGHRNYLRRPEYAQELRRRVVPGIDDIAGRLRRRKAGEDDDDIDNDDRGPLQIGLLNRKRVDPGTANRVITNMDAIAAGLEEALGGGGEGGGTAANSVVLSQDFPGDGSLKDQATWFATKDVIIAPHGAALANALFVTEGTIVVQAYPPGFYWTSLDPLIEQAGGLALDWYDGDNPLEAFYDVQKDYRKKNNAQHQDFDVPVNEIVDIVLVALGRRAPSELTKSEWR